MIVLGLMFAGGGALVIAGIVQGHPATAILGGPSAVGPPRSVRRGPKGPQWGQDEVVGDGVQLRLRAGARDGDRRVTWPDSSVRTWIGGRVLHVPTE